MNPQSQVRDTVKENSEVNVVYVPADGGGGGGGGGQRGGGGGGGAGEGADAIGSALVVQVRKRCPVTMCEGRYKSVK